MLPDTRCRCRSCGKVWYYRECDTRLRTPFCQRTTLKLGAFVILSFGRSDKEAPVNLSRCPGCGSRAVVQRPVEFAGTG